MNVLHDILTVAVVTAGLYFMLMGGIGLIRLPEFFSRSHASSTADTVGIMLLLGGLAIYEGFSLVSLKLVIGLGFVALANPVGIHSLARAGHRLGLKPWKRKA